MYTISFLNSIIRVQSGCPFNPLKSKLYEFYMTKIANEKSTELTPIFIETNELRTSVPTHFQSRGGNGCSAIRDRKSKSKNNGRKRSNRIRAAIQ